MALTLSFMKRHLLLFTLCFVFCHSLSAQNRILYSHDAAGNRILRQLGNNQGGWDSSFWGEIGVSATMGALTGLTGYKVMKGLGKWNPLPNTLKKVVPNNWTRYSITTTVYSGITGSITGLEYDLFNGICYGEWNSFGEKTLLGFTGGLVSGASTSALYCGMSRLGPKEDYIKNLDYTSKDFGKFSGQYFENEFNGINATYVVCDSSLRKTFVYTYVPNPINGAVPIQNMYMYDNFEGLYELLLRLHY